MERLSRDEFAAFYQITAPALRRYLTGILPRPDLADDVLQEAYIRLIHSAPAAGPKRRAYLYRTATNLAWDHCRAERREREGLAAWLPFRPLTAEPVTGLSQAFRRLGPRDRSLLWLAYVEGATHAEIGAALGCARLSVKVLLFRARRRMEQLLSPKLEVKEQLP